MAADRMNGITRDTFDTLDHDGKLGVLFDGITGIKGMHNNDHESCEQQVKDCKKRFKALEDRKILNTAAAGGGGIFGGFLAMAAKAFFWR